MNLDYSYCLNEHTCIHRRSCRKWLGNYDEGELILLFSSNRDKYISDKECINSEPLPFEMLERFRLSDRSEIK